MKTKYRAACVAVGLLLAVPSSAAAASQSDIDPSFGSGGTLQLPNALIGNGPVPLAVQSDGAVVVAARESEGVVVRRFTSEGVPDTNFGAGGEAVLPTGGGLLPSVKRVVVEPSGRILVYGGMTVALVARTAVWALDSAGQPIASFGTSGLFLYPLAGSEGNLPGDLAVTSTGWIVSADEVKTSGNSTLSVRRLTPSGTTAASIGVTVLGESIAPSAVAETEPGKFISAIVSSAGDAKSLLNQADPFTAAQPFGTGVFSVLGPAAGGSPRIVRAFFGQGTLGVVGEWGKTLAYQRAAADGKTDVDGATFARAIDYQYPLATAVDGGSANNGGAAVVGTLTSSNVSIKAKVGIARFTATGSADTAFGGGDGVAPIEFPAQRAAGFVRQPSGKYILSGVSDSGNLVYLARIWGDAAVPLPPTQELQPAVARFSSSLKSKLRRAKSKRIAGVASGSGLMRVELAIQRVDKRLLKKSRRCLYVKSASAKFKRVKAVKGKCRPSKFLRAPGTTNWSFSFRKSLRPGRYVFSVRAVGALGIGEIHSKSVKIVK